MKEQAKTVSSSETGSSPLDLEGSLSLAAIFGGKPTWAGGIAMFFGLIAVILTWALTLSHESYPDWIVPGWLAFFGALSVGVAWVCTNIDRHATKMAEEKKQLRERGDLDGLVTAFERVLPSLHQIAKESPDGFAAKSYVKTVLDALRERLEPPGIDDNVRVNLYRRDQEELRQEAEGAARFNLYAHSQGGRSDIPRSCFQDDQGPGKNFMPVLKARGRYWANSPSDFFVEDTDITRGVPAYKSFVNLALTGSDGEPYAMLTADSLVESYFDPRKERLMRAFQQLIELALTYSTKDSDVPKPVGLSTEEGEVNGELRK